jgi:hypothetical protein
MADPLDEELEVPRAKLKRVRKRVLEAEKDKLNLKLPRGINDDIEQIIREEITE